MVLWSCSFSFFDLICISFLYRSKLFLYCFYVPSALLWSSVNSITTSFRFCLLFLICQLQLHYLCLFFLKNIVCIKDMQSIIFRIFLFSNRTRFFATWSIESFSCHSHIIQKEDKNPCEFCHQQTSWLLHLWMKLLCNRVYQLAQDVVFDQEHNNFAIKTTQYFKSITLFPSQS